MDNRPSSPRAQMAYDAYYALGVDRSLAKLSQIPIGNSTVNLRQLEVWSSKYNWVELCRKADHEQREREHEIQERVKAAEIKRQAEREIARSRARDRMNDERADIFRGQWAKTLKMINDKVEIGDVKGIMALTTLLNRALDEERQSLGSPTQSIALTNMDGGPLQVQFVLPHVLNDEGDMPHDTNTEDRD